MRFWRLIALAVLFFVVRVALDGNGIDLPEPAAEIDLLATTAAKGHGVASGWVELLFADWAANHAFILPKSC